MTDTDDTDDLPSIDMTGERDQAFMDTEAAPSTYDAQEHYERLVAEFEEKGWDPSVLEPPDDGEGAAGETEKAYRGLTLDEYEKADDALLEAHEKLVQWNADKDLSEYDLSKAPGVWESQDDVPEFVLDTLERLIVSGGIVWQGGYERLPPGAEAVVMGVLEDKLTQPQGWSLSSLRDDLKDHYPEHEDEYLLNILRNETSAVLNTAREEAFEESEGPGEEFEYDWVGPTDHRTTDTCLAIEDRIEDHGGSVPMPLLKEILYEEALAHADNEGTPERVDQWQPHWQCRRTFVRRVL